jgi:hypothetical protein
MRTLLALDLPARSIKLVGGEGCVREAMMGSARAAEL